MTSTSALTNEPAQALRPVTAGMSVRCPDLDCGRTADVVDTWVWSSTDGPQAA